jgi:hypothetical protein
VIASLEGVREDVRAFLLVGTPAGRQLLAKLGRRINLLLASLAHPPGCHD